MCVCVWVERVEKKNWKKKFAGSDIVVSPSRQDRRGMLHHASQRPLLRSKREGDDDEAQS